LTFGDNVVTLFFERDRMIIVEGFEWYVIFHVCLPIPSKILTAFDQRTRSQGGDGSPDPMTYHYNLDVRVKGAGRVYYSPGMAHLKVVDWFFDVFDNSSSIGACGHNR